MDENSEERKEFQLGISTTKSHVSSELGFGYQDAIKKINMINYVEVILQSIMTRSIEHLHSKTPEKKLTQLQFSK